MKLAGVLAIVLAIILGGWASVDYMRNKSEGHRIAAEGMSSALHEMEYGGSDNGRIEREYSAIENAERDDAFAGIGAAVCLIAGIALYSKG